MKKYNITKISLLVAMTWSSYAMSQTVNTGELYLSPGTQFATVGAFNNTVSGSFFNDGEAFIYSHFNNNGSVDFTPGKGGYTRFEGTAVQQLTGGSVSYFYNVLFNNSASNTASFELKSEISIVNEANFDTGIVKNDTFGGLVVFENNAVHTNTHNGSHVDGLVQKNGNTAFGYPIGDGGYFRYAGISAPSNSNDVFTAKYFLENPNSNYPLASRTGIIEVINNQEYWTVTREAGNSEVLLTLSWDESTTTPAGLVSGTDALHIVRWDEVQQLWVDEGGVADPANRTVTTLTSLEKYGIFTLARVKVKYVLPANVVVYNAVSSNGNGQNDYLLIDNIQDLPNNKVEVFNRWGVKVFETTNYGTSGNVFDGFSNGRMTVVSGNKLPSGTYFYVLTYDHNDGTGTQRVKHSGYLQLNAD